MKKHHTDYKARFANGRARTDGQQRRRGGQPAVRLALALCAACILSGGHVVTAAGQQQPRGAGGANRAAVVAGQAEFTRVAAQAEAARAGAKYDEAIALYRRALGLKPQWDEGWWYLATLLYDRDAYAEAVPAFQATARLQPKVGAPWGLLGLCEFQLGRYDDALADIQHARQLGVQNNPQLVRVLRYHEGLLWLVKGEFETAQLMLDSLALDGLNSEDLVKALGLAVLRVPAVPARIDAQHRDYDLIRRAGWAELQSAQKNVSDAGREYERLVTDYPKAPNLQYAYGRFLVTHRDEEKGQAAFLRELENSPDHTPSLLQLAYSKLRNKDTEAGLPYAEHAVRLNPRDVLGHYLLGRLLFDAGQNDRAIEELETAQRIVPDEARLYFALTRAYTRANRKADAARARDTFTRLNQREQEAAAREGRSATLPASDADKPERR